MIGLDVVLLRPLWLIGVPLALLAGALAYRTADGLARWRRVIDPDLLAALRRLGHVTEARRESGPWLLASAAALVTAGLAGPATRNPDAPALLNLDALMILLDLSPSVTEGGGFDDARAAVSRLIDTHGTRPVALAVYAGESFLVSVPSEDPAGLQSVVAVVGDRTMPIAGSRPDRALALARRTLSDARAARPDIVIVTDGGGIGPEALDLARRIEAGGARLSAVFVAPGAAPYGMPPADRDRLVALSTAGGGLTVDATDTAPLEARLADRQGAATVDPALHELRYTDHGRGIAALALLPLGLLFRRRRRA